MKYSLINVNKDDGKTVDGNWIQDFTGTLQSALCLAKEIEVLNGNKIKVAVVEQGNSTTPILHYFTGLRKA